jgi:amino acid permease
MRYVQLISLILSVALLVLFIYFTDIKIAICPNSASTCGYWLESAVYVLFLAPIALVVSLVKTTEDAKIARLLAIFLIIQFIFMTLPLNFGSGLAGPSLSKGLIAFLLAGIYCIISIIYIFILKRKEKK